MRIIKATADAERRIAASMYCIERGQRVVDNDGKKLAEPAGGYALFPEIKVDPVTKKGIPVLVSYKASVGVIFYSAGSKFDPGAFACRLATALDQYDDDHLRRHRSVAVTPCATLRCKPLVDGRTEVIGPRVPVGLRRNNGDPLPPRIIIHTPPNYHDIPSHISIMAPFTWIIMGGAPIIDIYQRPSIVMTEALNVFNASVASIFYDAAGVLSFADNADTMMIASKNLTMPALSAELKAINGASWQHEAILVTKSGNLEVVNDRSTLAITVELETKDFHEEKMSTEAARSANVALESMSCLLCAGALWGDVILIQSAREPRHMSEIAGSMFSEWNLPLKAGTDILGGRSAAICLYCFHAMSANVVEDLHCTFTRSKVQRSQAAALADSRLSHLIPLVTAGKAIAIEDCPGCFVVGRKWVIAPSSNIPFSEINSPTLMQMKLPIVRLPAIAEQR